MIVGFPGVLGVALRKESVDRNINYTIDNESRGTSLSARRAWIEMSEPKGPPWAVPCRSPQGERG